MTKRDRTAQPVASGEELPLRRVLGALGCAVFVLAAIGVEVAAGQAANSPQDARFATLVPLGWPQAARVLWWVLVAVAAAGHRLLLDPRPGVRRRVLAAGLAAPFLVFAAGIGAGADWATWH